MYCTPKALYNHVCVCVCGGGGVSPQPPPVCSIHLDDATAATGQRHQCAHHTPATGGEERESIKCIRSPHTSYRWRGECHRANSVDGDYWEAMIDKGQWREFGQDTGVTPLLFMRNALGFLMTTEWGPRFNVSSERRCFLTVVSPSLYWAVRTHTDCRVSTPCWPH